MECANSTCLQGGQIICLDLRNRMLGYVTHVFLDRENHRYRIFFPIIFCLLGEKIRYLWGKHYHVQPWPKVSGHPQIAKLLNTRVAAIFDAH